MEVKIVCNKISNKLNLIALASYFDIPYNRKNSNYIVLNGKAISSIIKVQSNSKFLFIYEYGCIVFVDFYSDEIYLALDYLETITSDVDYRLISQFNENLILTINNSQLIIKINDYPCKLEYNEAVVNIACSLIAKSTELSADGTQITAVLDDAENIVNYLQRAKLKIHSKKFVSRISHMARFQSSIIRSLGSFDSSFTLNRNVNSKSFYKILHYYYEIADRTNVLQSKIDQVNKLISSYTTLSYNIGEMRLLIFECVLLFMFLLPHLINFKALLK